jgi:hypothetical protein
MANPFGTDILLQSPSPGAAAAFYVEQPGFTIQDPNGLIDNLRSQ